MSAVRTQYMSRLNDCLARFKATPCNDITEHYEYYPDLATAKLGSGSYGSAFRMRELGGGNGAGAVRVVKEIQKARITNSSLQIQHLCAELAVTGLMHHPYINRRVGLFHSTTHVYMVLELCGADVPDVQTRLALLFATHFPSRIAEIPTLMQQLRASAGVSDEEKDTPEGQAKLTQHFEKSPYGLQLIMAEIGAKREHPVSSDLFNTIVAMKRVPDGLARIITKQALTALEHMHSNMVCHRDVKTENLVVAVKRKAELLFAGESGECTGVRITETVDCRLIDFGLVKYMALGAFPSVISPGTFGGPGSTPGAVKGGIGSGPAGGAGANPFGGGGGGSSGGKIDLQKMGFDDDDDGPAPGPSPFGGGGAAPNPFGGSGGGAAAGGAGKLPSSNNKPAGGGGFGSFPIAVTPCGTELYCSLEAIDGIISSGVGKAKWQSNSALLPKLDVYGVGTMLFCMANGRPPFRPPRDTYRQVTREERMRQVQRLVANGPIFSNGVSEGAKACILSLMTNDPASRPDATQALQLPFLRACATTNSYCWEVSVSGTRRDAVISEPQSDTVPPAPNNTLASTEVSSAGATAPLSEGPASPESTAQEEEEDDDAEEEEIVMAVLRGKEDNGDAAGKNWDVEQK